MLRALGREREKRSTEEEKPGTRCERKGKGRGAVLQGEGGKKRQRRGGGKRKKRSRWLSGTEKRGGGTNYSGRKGGRLPEREGNRRSVLSAGKGEGKVYILARRKKKKGRDVVRKNTPRHAARRGKGRGKRPFPSLREG